MLPIRIVTRKELKEESISKYPKFVILCDKKPVGCLSVEMECAAF